MPDLSTRNEHEKDLAAAILLVFQDHRDRVAETNRATDWPELGAELQDAITPELQAIYEEAARQLADQQGVDLDDDKLAAAALLWSQSYAATLALEITHTTHQRVMDALQEARLPDAGSLDSLLDSVFGDVRSEMIGITETTRAITAGEAFVALAVTVLGIGMLEPTWETDFTDPCEEICEPLMGMGIEVYGLVSPTGPPAHPNCRCFLSYSLVPNAETV